MVQQRQIARGNVTRPRVFEWIQLAIKQTSERANKFKRGRAKELTGNWNLPKVDRRYVKNVYKLYIYSRAYRVVLWRSSCAWYIQTCNAYVYVWPDMEHTEITNAVFWERYVRSVAEFAVNGKHRSRTELTRLCVCVLPNTIDFGFFEIESLFCWQLVSEQLFACTVGRVHFVEWICSSMSWKVLAILNGHTA